MSKLTAITRTSISGPTRYLSSQGLIKGRVLDYGCGKGFDADTLGIEKFDPNWCPALPKGKFDTIICNYVLNVVEPSEVKAIIAKVKKLLRCHGVAYFSVRRDLPLTGKAGRGCYQHYVKLSGKPIKQTSLFAIYKKIT